MDLNLITRAKKYIEYIHEKNINTIAAPTECLNHVSHFLREEIIMEVNWKMVEGIPFLKANFGIPFLRALSLKI